MRSLRHFPTIASILLLLALAFPVVALGGGPFRSDRPRNRDRGSVPEFDPMAAGAIVTLIAGGGVLIARRRK